MKINTYYLFFVALLALALNACKKQEILHDTPPNIVNLTLNGISTKNLEFVFRDEVIARWDITGGKRDLSVMLDLAGDTDGEIQVREMGSTDILTTRTITTSPFEQNLSIYYDNGEIYSDMVFYNVKGYVQSGDLEFVVDDKVLAEVSFAVDMRLDILLNEGENKELQVRVKGETEPRMTIPIDVNQTGGDIRFFFDGTEMIEDLPELTPPSDPANMAINAQFNPIWPGSLPPTFSGDAEVDLVFFVRSSATNNSGTVTNPGIRITVPTDGTFVAFELPPLPDDQSVYTFDIYRKGTDITPYSNFAQEALFPPELSKGRYGSMDLKNGHNDSRRYFEAGSSQLLLLTVGSSTKVAPVPRARFVYGTVNQNLAQYFQ